MEGLVLILRTMQNLDHTIVLWKAWYFKLTHYVEFRSHHCTMEGLVIHTYTLCRVYITSLYYGRLGNSYLHTMQSLDHIIALWNAWYFILTHYVEFRSHHCTMEGLVIHTYTLCRVQITSLYYGRLGTSYLHIMQSLDHIIALWNAWYFILTHYVEFISHHCTMEGLVIHTYTLCRVQITSLHYGMLGTSYLHIMQSLYHIIALWKAW